MELRRMINPAFALAIQNLRHQSTQDLQTMFTANRENLVRHLEALIGRLDELRDILSEGPDEDGEMLKLEAYIQRVGKEWEKWDTKRHSGKWEDRQKIEPAANLFGGIGNMLTPRRPSRDDDEE